MTHIQTLFIQLSCLIAIKQATKNGPGKVTTAHECDGRSCNVICVLLMKMKCMPATQQFVGFINIFICQLVRMNRAQYTLLECC